jgi:O-methyltransferase domain/Dimerisation domain
MSSDTASHLMKLINGFQVSQAISVAATLGIPDLLRHGPQSCNELAVAAGAHPASLYRLLRALAAGGVLEELDGRQFVLTALGQPLRTDVPSSRNAWARLMGQSNYWEAWCGLLGSVQTGETAFNRVHGTSVWTYRANHPSDAATFDRAMGTITEQIAEAVLAVLDFGEYRTVADIGGGEGAFLAKILGAYPSMRGILFDQPHVATKARQHLSALAQRCEVIGGDFFSAVPTGADAYLLKWILHDWDDERAAALLRSCRRAMPSTSSLIVVEYVVAPPNQGSEGKFMDLNMMVITGGAERTRNEFDHLFGAAGFKLVDATLTGMHATVLVARPV